MSKSKVKKHPVVIKQPAAGRWRCDACKEYGFGGTQLLVHSTETDHRVYSPC